MLSRRQLIRSAVGLAGLAYTQRSHGLAQSPASADIVDAELWSYLSLSPLSIANPTQPMPLLAGNQQLQAETLGISLPIDLADPDQRSSWFKGMVNVALPSFVMNYALQEDFMSLTGFSTGQVSSGAEIGEPPSMVTFLRGNFDLAQIQAAQAALGYRQLDVDGQAVSSLSEEADFDASNPLQRIALARMNNFTVLNDGTLVYAATLDLIRQVLAPELTLASVSEYARALQTLDSPLITGMALGPGSFGPGIPLEVGLPLSQDDIAAFILAMQEKEPAPIVLAAIAGNTPGGPLPAGLHDEPATPIPGPKSLTKFALTYATPQDAEKAAGQIEERLATGTSTYTMQPWTELFAFWSAVAHPELSIVLLTIEWVDRAARTTDLIFHRDVGFITG